MTGNPEYEVSFTSQKHFLRQVSLKYFYSNWSPHGKILKIIGTNLKWKKESINDNHGQRIMVNQDPLKNLTIVQYLWTRNDTKSQYKTH